MNKPWGKIVPVALLVLVPAILLRNLFFPTAAILVTPDFGRSDAWDFSFATKFLLAESLKADTLPTWTAQLGTGFPLIGEGQIGAFFLPNLILFRFFAPALAYNLSLVAALAIGASGMYLLLRRFSLGWLSALFGGLTFGLSGVLVPQLTHHTLIQGITLMPAILAACDMLLSKPSLKRIALFAFLASQQMLAGFPQATFITMLLVFSYAAWVSVQKKRITLLMPICAAALLALGLGAIQLVPSYEFLRESSVAEGFSPGDATFFSYPPTHVKTLLSPYLLGNPKEGTYPPYTTFDGSIFWENTGFFGSVGLALSLAGIVLLLRRRKHPTQFFVWAAALAFLLMLGKYSPLYIVFSFWPFHLFRVPSRFLWVFILALIVLASYTLDYIVARRHRGFLVLGSLLLVVNTLQLFSVWKGYHMVGDETVWLTPPKTISSVAPNARIYTIGTTIPHNKAFLTQGWQDPSPYLKLRGALAPDANVIWGMPSLEVYAGRQLRRQGILASIIASEIAVSEAGATVSATATNLLRAGGVGTIISALPLTITPPMPPSFSEGGIEVYLLEGATRAYLATDVRAAETLSQAATILKDNTFIAGRSVLLANSDAKGIATSSGTARVLSETNTTLTLEVDASGEGLLVVADTLYPGWIALVDGVPAPILPANLSYRAVVVPAGAHTVSFVFRPRSLYIGAIISGITALFTVFLAVSPRPDALFRTSQKAQRRARGHRRNPYT